MRTQSLALAPGPRGYPLLGNALAFRRRDRLFAMLQDAQRYGDIVRYRIGPTVAHVLHHPEDIRHILLENHENYVKGRGQKRVSVILGQGLITSEGALWKRQRRLMQPAFRLKRMHALVSSMAETIASRLEAWRAYERSGQPFDVAQEVLRLSLAIVGRSLFGADLDDEAEAMTRAATLALKYATSQRIPVMSIPLFVPTPSNRRLTKAIAEVDRIVSALLEARRGGDGTEGDLLSLLLLARDPDTGEAMSARQLRDEVVTLIGAGHETVANGLAWALYLLGRHPAVFRCLREEVDSVLGDRAPQLEDLAALRYTRMVAEESLRMYPPVWMFGRRALSDDSVRGYHLPKGSLVGICTYFLHRHPDFWPNPEGFDPARFAERAQAAQHKYAYLPFGAGPRTCIGNAFAIYEMQMVLAMIAQRYGLALASKPPVRPAPMFTLRPEGGVWVRIESKRGV